jgi:hypothetical protein
VGRGVAVVFMIVGIGLVGVVTASVASYFITEARETDPDPAIVALEERLARIEQVLEQLTGQETIHPD